jgi:hypothetical protein
MDEHQRYELRGEAARNATHASVRSRDVLHHVQPVRTVLKFPLLHCRPDVRVGGTLMFQ